MVQGFDDLNLETVLQLGISIPKTWDDRTNDFVAQMAEWKSYGMLSSH
jgi:hypothetical protein